MPGGGSITSTGNGDWNTGATWSDSNDPGCAITSDYVIQAGDSVWSTCATLEIGGTGSITIESGGILYISGAGGLNGNGDFTIESGGKLIVDGDFAVAGNGDLVLDGTMSVGGGFSVTGSGSGTGTGTLTITGTGCDDWSGPGACTDGTPLPIELVSFEAHLNINQVDLKWITASEKNNDFFTIERSTDGENFTEVFHVEGAGNSNQYLEYFDIDYEPMVGIVYYRLKQTDFDGQYAYSGLVPVEYTEDGTPGTGLFGNVKADIKIWPTPNDGTHINIEMSGYDPSHEVLVIVRDIAGREYYSKVLITDMDGHLISAIDPANRLPVGTYLITGSDQNHLYSKRLIVK